MFVCLHSHGRIMKEGSWKHKKGVAAILRLQCRLILSGDLAMEEQGAVGDSAEEYLDRWMG